MITEMGAFLQGQGHSEEAESTRRVIFHKNFQLFWVSSDHMVLVHDCSWDRLR